MILNYINGNELYEYYKGEVTNKDFEMQCKEYSQFSIRKITTVKTE